MSREDFIEYLDYQIMGVPLQEWLIAAAVSVAALILLYIVLRIGTRYLHRIAQANDKLWDDAVTHALKRTRSLFLVVFGLYAGSLSLELAPDNRALLTTIASLALIVQVGLWLNDGARFWFDNESKRRRKADPATVTTISAMSFITRLVLWVVVVMLFLDNLGINVTALVAGLGVGGIAVALAVQNILGDLFASLTIVLDKPFAVGDFLIIDEHLGAVEHVGLKSTRLRSLSGEQLVFSNNDLLKSRIRNYGRMFERRVVFKFGVTYQTPHDKLEQIPAMVREAIEQQDKVRFDRSHFFAYGSSSLDFETVYYVLSPDYNLYMDIQQAINLAIHARFEKEGVEFAYPTQTLYVHKADVS